MVSNVDSIKSKRMKKIVIGFSILIICFYCGLSFARGPERPQKSIEEIVNNVVRPFFVTLKNGDIVTLKRLMTKDLYEDRKVLFEQNKAYPSFLRKLYRDADFIIVSANKKGNDILVNAVTKYSDGRQNKLALYLTNKGNRNWKISRKPCLE
jgi:hypothetical protein